ncbi:MAG: SlyX family protein [Bacteriovoracaceae bacterium]|nr:SlyX family protein [Bacteriovoracaceae bacterium]
MNKEIETLQKQVVDLEIRYAHQEDLLEQLNKIVTTHEFTIDKLVKDIRELKLNSNGGQDDVPNEKPPHY